LLPGEGRDRMSAMETSSDPEQFSAPSFCVDSDHPLVLEYASVHKGESTEAIDRAVSLYYAIRDEFPYSPWGVEPSIEGFRASVVLGRPRERGAHCIDKATVLAACARALGIPARLHFANVRNHIGTAKLEEQLGTDVLVFHGYCEFFLEEKWVAATPAFNRALCEKLGVAPLEFDGRENSIFQEFDHAGGRFMEYVHDYGSYRDIPYELMVSEWKKYYPTIAKGGWPRRPSP
jgi:transglutaminase-like putative cysteine protease